MNKKLIPIIACVLALALLLGACRSEDQIAESQSPGQTVISPDVNITQESEADKRSVVVNGTGEANLTPDMATVYISVTTSDAKADETQRLNSEAMTKVMAALIENGIAEKDITTENISLNERYDYEKSPAKLVGYEMTNTLKVIIRNIDSVGKVISDAVAAGATGTYGLNFSVSDSSAAYQDALRAAIVDAGGKAQAIADALGVTLAPVPLTVNEQSISYTPYKAEDVRVAVPQTDSSAEAVISKGELIVTANISISYEIVEPTANG